MSDDATIVFWLVFSLCVSGLAMTLVRARLAAPGWLAVYLAILLASVAGWARQQPAMIYTAAAVWLLLVLLPTWITRLCNRHLLQQDYAAARRLAWIVSRLHPGDGLQELPEIIHALELAQQGEVTAASETLKRFQGAKSSTGLTAIVIMYRITNQWEDLLAWYSRRRCELEPHSALLPTLLRAHGETGDLRGLVALYDVNQRKIQKLAPPTSRESCRLMLFAFCGRPEAVASLCAGSLAVLPAAVRGFWLATADLAAGAREAAKRRLEQLLPAADPPLRGALERRLSQASVQAEPLDAWAERVVEDAIKEHRQEERFGEPRSLLSNQARATQVLIAINVFMFMAEVWLGSSTDVGTLYRLGGLFPPAVRAGAWWRLIVSSFLHFGPLHLVMNMVGLWILGPFAEFALGSRRFVLVYLLAGIGSMTMVLACSSGPQEATLTVGASGCVMGLVGAWGALMLRGWLREKASVAKRRLVVMLMVLSIQTLFDLVAPHVSMTAHLSGALIGFACTMVLRDRLISR